MCPTICLTASQYEKEVNKMPQCIGANLKRHFRQSAIAVNICWWNIIAAFSFSILSTYFCWKKVLPHIFTYLECDHLVLSVSIQIPTQKFQYVYGGIFGAINTVNLWRFGPAGKFAKFTLCFIQTLHKCFPGSRNIKLCFKIQQNLKKTLKNSM